MVYLSRHMHRPRRVLLVRHGKPEFPEAKHYMYGHTDYALSEEGQLQAEQLGRVFSNISFDRVVTSDLTRAKRTAEIIVEQNWQVTPGIEVHPQYREIFMGEWEGVTTDRIQKQFPELYEARGRDITSVSAPGGETFEELKSRSMLAFKSLLEEPSRSHNILLVAHGGFFWALLCELFGLPLGKIFSFRHDYCGVHVIGEVEDHLSLVSYNWTPSLGGF